MGKLRVEVLGRPSVSHGGVPVDLNAKATALLGYLAVTGKRHSRRELAGLLWGELPDHRARANLRMLLLGLRRTLRAHIDVSARDVGPGADWQVDLDELSNLLTAGDRFSVARLRTLVRADLMDGLDVPGAPGFETWLAGERRRIRDATIEGLGASARAMAGCDPEQALSIARDLLALDPLDEAVHRLTMELLAATGRRAAALAQFETCRLVLADELGVDPSAETVLVRDRLLREDRTSAAGYRDARPAADDADADTRRPDPDVRFAPRPFPAPAGPLVGRESETARVKALLLDEACRLLTLVGPGGVGKTRLAIGAVPDIAHAFDAVAFVSLAALPSNASPSVVAGEVAQKLGLPPWKDSPLDALRRVVARRKILLVLDNVEHLDLAELLTALLDGSPGLTVLATSRQRIGLGTEWLFDVAGLAYPDSVKDGLEDAPAAVLLAGCARQVRPGFSIADDPESVLQICQLVGGLPLALELAAQWTRSLATREVAQLIGSDLDALATNHGIVADRQRSMRSVLEATWRLLDRSQHRMLARLSVFRGGFSVDAARVVAGASPADLAGLVDRSVVRPGISSRFDLHELLRQFAASKLDEDPGNAEDARSRHAQYFASRAAAHAGEPTEQWPHTGQDGTEQALEPDLANIRAATRWLAAHGGEDELAACVHVLWHLDQRSGRFAEALGMLDAALSRPDISAARAATWHRWAGTAAFQLGRVERTIAETEAAFAALGQPLPRHRPALRLAIARECLRQVMHRLVPARPLPPGARGKEEAIIEMLSVLGNTMYNLQQPLPVAFYTLRSANAADRCHDPGAASAAYAELGHGLAMLGWHGLGRRYGELADALVARARNSDLALLGLETRALSHVANAAWADLDALVARATISAHKQAEHRLAIWHALAGVAALYQGRFADALASFGHALGGAQAFGDQFATNWCVNGLTDATLGLGGDLCGVAALQAEAVERSRDLAPPEILKSAAVLAAVRLAQGQDQAALTLARAARSTVPDVRFYPAWAMEAYSHLAQVWLALWDIAAEPRPELVSGARLACRQLDRFARAHPVARPRALWASGWLACLGGRPRRAVKTWEQSLVVAERMAMPYDQARAHAALAENAADARADEHRDRADEIVAFLRARPVYLRLRPAGYTIAAD
ncbi:AfsR/SARP family transcriptional regulator [Phytoactinopolyspora mesophila]|nr:BTAD domain-containing putative transcriptional regulator [Phytoactinopolyspora mesophila]